MIKIKTISLCLILLSFLWSCESHEEFTKTMPEGTISIRMTALNMTDNNELDTESNIYSLKGFRFEDGILEEIFEQLTLDDEGTCTLQPAQMRGDVYFLANASKALQTYHPQAGVSTLTEFLQWKATTEAMTAEGLLMTGQIELSASMPSQTSVQLRRSIARIDLDSPLANVEIHSITLKKINTVGYIHPQNDFQAPETDWNNLTRNFEEVPFKSRKETLFYLCEQGNEKREVEILASIQGAWHRLKTTLPPIVRNTVYTLKVYGTGAEIQATVLTDDWEQGISSESDLVQKGWIDRASSVLPEGVNISPKGDTVYIPYQACNIQLALMTQDEINVEVNGYLEDTTISPLVVRNIQKQRTMVNVSKAKQMPTTMASSQYVYLDIYKQRVLIDRVVLNFTPNPLGIQEGIIAFDSNGICDFNDYADGKLADFTVPADMTLHLNIGEGEPEWAKLYPPTDATNIYTLEGGWRPNDPDADGRIQTAELILKDAEGKQIDSYIVKRRNWGLPVVNINGTWWCKYNLRGNVKSFEDQIRTTNDPVKNGNIATYLSSCSNEEFLALLGDQYQGGNPEGLKLSYKNGDFHYEGFQTSAQDFGALKATEMAPSGYEVPSYDNYRFFSGGNNPHNFKLPYGSDGFENRLGQRVLYTSQERNVTYQGGNYGPVHYYDFSYEDAHLVLLGLGNQQESVPGSVDKMTILLATSGTVGKSWFLEGYAVNSSNQGATWIKYQNQNAPKTRTIRCIKSKVNYIY